MCVSGPLSVRYVYVCPTTIYICLAYMRVLHLYIYVSGPLRVRYTYVCPTTTYICPTTIYMSPALWA